MWKPAALLCTLLTAAWGQGIEKTLTIVNDSGISAELYWIDPRNGEPILMSDPSIVDGATFPLKSWVGHEFEVREVPNPSTGACSVSPDKICKTHNFVIGNNDDQVITIGHDFDLIITDGKTKASDEAADVIQSCREKALKTIANDASSATQAMEEMLKCVEVGIAKQMEEANEEIAYQSQVRRAMAATLENYTCEDHTVDTSPDVDTRWWVHKDGVNRTIHVKFERPASRIHVLENFINDEECRAMEEAAAPTLHHATVADGKGGSQLSEHRKAMQAGITVQWEKEAEGDPIAVLSRRVYDYTNHVLGLDIKENGQEDLMSIQYFGRGINDTAPDRYTPHCDGDCTGLPHKYGTRMATMVLYCDVPEKGGHTNFRNAGVHVAPVRGNGIFFSYIDPKTKIMDTGFTEHSGCPVFEGQKKIVTQWIRYGVDDDNPWNSFNTLGIKHADASEQ